MREARRARPPLKVSVDDHAGLDECWDRLVQASAFPSVFLTSGWLRSWKASFAADADVRVVTVRRAGEPVAGAVFRASRGVVEFAGKGPSDYADVVVHGDLDEALLGEVIDRLLRAAAASVSGFRCFSLNRIPAGSRALPLLTSSSFYATVRPEVAAPRMDMCAAPKVLRKKSLRRHERGLEKAGQVVCATYCRASDILPRLEDFFALHVARWSDTPHPSQFHQPRYRDFYRAVTEHCDDSGVLRFTELRLDDRLVAAHFGFHMNGQFIWYKPCFDPALARMSPGEVLIKRLIERAAAEQARVFDFTIGDEAFKLRFATSVPWVSQVYLTDSPLRHAAKRSRTIIRRALRNRGRTS